MMSALRGDVGECTDRLLEMQSERRVQILKNNANVIYEWSLMASPSDVYLSSFSRSSATDERTRLQYLLCFALFCTHL